MSRLLGVVGAAALLASAGCMSFLGGGIWWDEHKLIADGPPEVVQAMLQTGLAEGGAQLQPAQRHGDEIFLAGLSKGKRVFCLHLKKAAGGEGQTLVRVRWNDQEADPNFWPLVNEILAPQDLQPSPTPAGS